MEIDELKSAWQKKNKKLDSRGDDCCVIVFEHKSWFVRNRIAIEGLLCIIVSLFLIAMLAIQNFNFVNKSTMFIYISWFIIAIYMLVKGVFTLLFFIKSCKFDMATSKFLQINLKNQLYFVYEKMIWLWFILPLIIVVFPFLAIKHVDIQEDTILIYSIAIGILYLIALLVFSKSLWQKRRKLLSEIREIRLEHR
ncbi:MAG TPA: hypothetical protein PLY32_06200 [Salinivirgaceae bacterium]|nr:hypothetical protein [Salinivirgaceae bacterium]HQA76696.1 hypothetical protein [Salinivirgaceae bacterium]